MIVSVDRYACARSSCTFNMSSFAGREEYVCQFVTLSSPEQYPTVCLHCELHILPVGTRFGEEAAAVCGMGLSITCHACCQ